MDYNWSFKQFVMGMFTDDDGAPSSSRIITFILAMGSMGALIWIFHHIMWLTPDKLVMWLGALPTLIVSLIAMFMAPYSINRGSGSITDIANAVLQRKKGEDQNSNPQNPPQQH